MEPDTKKNEKPPGTYERNDINNAFKEAVEKKADEKAVKTFFDKTTRKKFQFLIERSFRFHKHEISCWK